MRQPSAWTVNTNARLFTKNMIFCLPQRLTPYMYIGTYSFKQEVHMGHIPQLRNSYNQWTYFWKSMIISTLIKREKIPFFLKKKWIFLICKNFSQGWLVSDLVGWIWPIESGQEDFKNFKILPMYFCFLASLGKGRGPWTNLNPVYITDLVKLAYWF